MSAEQKEIRGRVAQAYNSLSLKKITVTRSFPTEKGNLEVSYEYDVTREQISQSEYDLASLVAGMQTEIRLLAMCLGSNLISEEDWSREIDRVKLSYGRQIHNLITVQSKRQGGKK